MSSRDAPRSEDEAVGLSGECAGEEGHTDKQDTPGHARLHGAQSE